MTTQTIYGLICDAGDGSSHMRWFRNRDRVDQAWVNKGERVKEVTILGWY